MVLEKDEDLRLTFYTDHQSLLPNDTNYTKYQALTVNLRLWTPLHTPLAAMVQHMWTEYGLSGRNDVVQLYGQLQSCG